ncbi:MAG TPA: hypothetical protein VHT51_09670 [Micropepsaceae bacterium]|jgi:hypothetical protein|nr:hypothetical protein [Micropepsaceae bacterium]
MTRAAMAALSERGGLGRHIDWLRVLLFAVHLGIIAYVGLGWMIASRGALLFYALFLPGIILQWILNGGVSLVSNIENLARTGCWSDARNNLEGGFFKTMLQGVGVHATQAQITTALCFLMLIFWIAAVCHMMLVVTPSA